MHHIPCTLYLTPYTLYLVPCALYLVPFGLWLMVPHTLFATLDEIWGNSTT